MIRELKRAPWWAKGILGIMGLFVVLAIVGTAIGEDPQPESQVRAATTTAATSTVAPSVPATPASTPTARPTPAPDFDLALISGVCTSDASIGYITCEGFVQNISGRTIDNVMALITFKDANDTPISSDDALIDYDPLLPGQQSPWKVIARYNPAFANYAIGFKLLFGEALRTRNDLTPP